MTGMLALAASIALSAPVAVPALPTPCIAVATAATAAAQVQSPAPPVGIAPPSLARDIAERLNHGAFAVAPPQAVSQAAPRSGVQVAAARR